MVYSVLSHLTKQNVLLLHRAMKKNNFITEDNELRCINVSLTINTNFTNTPVENQEMVTPQMNEDIQI